MHIENYQKNPEKADKTEYKTGKTFRKLIKQRTDKITK